MDEETIIDGLRHNARILGFLASSKAPASPSLVDKLPDSPQKEFIKSARRTLLVAHRGYTEALDHAKSNMEKCSNCKCMVFQLCKEGWCMDCCTGEHKYL